MITAPIRGATVVEQDTVRDYATSVNCAFPFARARPGTDEHIAVSIAILCSNTPILPKARNDFLKIRTVLPALDPTEWPS